MGSYRAGRGANVRAAWARDGDGSGQSAGPISQHASSGMNHNFHPHARRGCSSCPRFFCTSLPSDILPWRACTMGVADLLLHKAPRRAPGSVHFAIARRYSIMYYSTSSSQRNCAAVVVGGGPAGITVLGNLLEQKDKLPAQRLLWADPHFRAGRVNARYREVPRSVPLQTQPAAPAHSCTATPPSSCSSSGPKPCLLSATSSRRRPSPMPSPPSANCPRTRAASSARPPTCV